jgi:hypothetical protein
MLEMPYVLSATHSGYAKPYSVNTTAMSETTGFNMLNSFRAKILPTFVQRAGPNDVALFRRGRLAPAPRAMALGPCRSHVGPSDHKEGDRDYYAEDYRPHNQQTIDHGPNIRVSFTEGLAASWAALDGFVVRQVDASCDAAPIN